MSMMNLDADSMAYVSSPDGRVHITDARILAQAKPSTATPFDDMVDVETLCDRSMTDEWALEGGDSMCPRCRVVARKMGLVTRGNRPPDQG